MSAVVRLFLALILSALPLFADTYTGDNAVVFGKLQRQLGSFASDHMTQHIARIPKRTVELEIFISSEFDLDIASKVLSEPARFEMWALSGINTKADGDSYRLKLLEMSPLDKKGERLRGKFSLSLPLLTTTFERTFKVTTRPIEKIYTVFAESEPNPDSFLEAADILMKVFPAPGSPGRAWVYVRGTIHLRSWLAYEALPERMIERETAPRVHKFLNNYLQEEIRIRSNLAPKRKAAGVEASALAHQE